MKNPRTASPVGSSKAADIFGWMDFMLTMCIWKGENAQRHQGKAAPHRSAETVGFVTVKSCLLTILYLHWVSASVHCVLRAVGGRSPPVEVELDGVVHIWKASAAHRHATPDLQDD